MVFSTRSLRDTKLNYEIAARYNVEFKCHSVGWNVAVVDKHADLDLAAKMIAIGKFYKSGQDVMN